ncbi:MAG: hypothetical protein AB7K71_26535 [Polyangiaceae bacterium]
MGLFDRAKRALFGGEGAMQAPAQVAKSPEQVFAEEVLGVILSEERVTRAEQAPDDVFKISVWVDDSEEPVHLFLNNLRRDTLEQPPDERRASIERFISILTDDRSFEWADVEGNLVSLLRNTAFLGFMEDGPLAQPFVRHVQWVIGVDRPDSIAIATRKQFEDWPISEEQAFESATNFVVRCAQGDALGPWDPDAPYPMFQIVSDNGYETSRLTLPGWLASLERYVESKPLCIFPLRHLVLVAGDAHPAGVSRLFETAYAEFESGGRRISPMVYTVDDGGRVIEYEPANDHPAWPLYNRNRLIFDLSEYEDQKAMLEERFEAQDLDVFVASLSVVGKDDDPGSHFSYAVWVDEVLTLLPKSDYVAFVRGEGEAGQTFMVPWDTAQQLVGDLMLEEPDMLPKRWRLESFPEGSMLEALREAAEEP